MFPRCPYFVPTRDLRVPRETFRPNDGCNACFRLGPRFREILFAAGRGGLSRAGCSQSLGISSSRCGFSSQSTGGIPLIGDDDWDVSLNVPDGPPGRSQLVNTRQDTLNPWRVTWTQLMTPGECNECHSPQPHAFAVVPRCRPVTWPTGSYQSSCAIIPVPLPRVSYIHRTCASAQASGTALSRIHQRSDYSVLIRVPRVCASRICLCTCCIALSRNRADQAWSEEMAGLIRWTILIIAIHY